ncbi:PilZ domain-containing protein [Anaeromyxobacter sp. PSR-1]|uniref:PilZ domain-containing protein n=2 Tax=unclassified Anaeromyxobacter TaxID=2620896 RepID=UPI0005E9C77C|nr:PilZ domain-containing protein [Anaeromyxobacter sp. PSR-1]GAO02966.1 pilZ domain protein [Anaeromyxobacter sp. PSR-1]
MRGFPQVDYRRDPRLPVSAPAVLAASDGRWDVIAEDFAAGGCRVVSPVPLRLGTAAYLTLQLPSGAGHVAATATVAWNTAAPPWRIGFAFARSGGEERARQVRTLLDANPRLGRRPLPLRPSARLRLGAPPDPCPVFTRDERVVLRAARDALAVRELFGRHAVRAVELRRALQGLMLHGWVQTGAARATDRRWSAVLAETLSTGGARATRDRPADGAGYRPLRGRRAQAFVDLARAESAEGHDASAVEWLQAALAASPEDPFILAALDALTVGHARG